MAALRQRDFENGWRLVCKMAEAAGDAAAFARLGTEELPRLVASEITTLSVCDLARNTRSVVTSPGAAISAADRAAFDRHFAEHPLVRFHSSTPRGGSHRISDSLSRREFRETALYNDYYRRVGIDHVIAVPLFVDKSLLVSFVLNRNGRDFSDREKRLLDLVCEPLAAFYRLVLAGARLRRASGHGARAGSAGVARGRQDRPRNRRDPRDEPAHGAKAPAAHLREAGGRNAHRSRNAGARQKNRGQPNFRSQGKFGPDPDLFLQQVFLVFDLRPLVGVGGRGLTLDDGLPAGGQLLVPGDPLLLVVGHVVLGEDGLHRAFRHAQGAVDALVGVDHQHVRPLPEAVHGADIHAVGVLALDAALGDDVSHLTGKAGTWKRLIESGV
jgi:hypothetical protein